MIAQCASCQGRFTAKRAHAKWCSERCRKRGYRGSTGAPLPPARREGAPLVSIAPLNTSADEGDENEGAFESLTRRKLDAAGRLDDYRGLAALYIAKVLDTAPQETGNGHAALVNSYVARMDAALDGAVKVESPIERARRTRELKVG